jgi:hypothetical protein
MIEFIGAAIESVGVFRVQRLPERAYQKAAFSDQNDTPFHRHEFRWEGSVLSARWLKRLSRLWRPQST